VSGRELAELAPSDAPILLAVGTAIDPDKRYRLATSMFTAMGWIEDGRAFQITDERVVVRDVIIDWIKQRKVIP
jgi:hypothetical protein